MIGFFLYIYSVKKMVQVIENKSIMHKNMILLLVKKTLYVLVFLSINLSFSQNEITKNVEVNSAGWKKVARLDGAYGRGYNEITLFTKGGATAPRVSKISWFKGWSYYGGLNLTSLSDADHWSDARITYDATNAYLEVNFTTAIPILSVYLNQSVWAGGYILDGTLPDGGGTVLLTAKFGRINFGENDLYLGYDGKVGIGTGMPDSKLTVNGNIHAEEVKVDLSVPGPDYVFKDGYDLKSLEEVQNYIKENGHLPNIPSAREMEENGIELGSMDMKLLEKIEELTLYILKQQESLKEVLRQNKLQQKEMDMLKKQNEKIQILEILINKTMVQQN